jgi:hypothetical protein
VASDLEPQLVCSVVDTRVSNKDQAGNDRDHAVGRYVASVQNNTTGAMVRGFCTATLLSCRAFGQANQTVMLTASHCFEAPGILTFPVVPPGADLTILSAAVQFNPPLSTAACAVNNPPEAQVFPVLFPTVRRGIAPPAVGGPKPGSVSDWAVFRTTRNAGTGRTAFEQQGAAYGVDLAGADLSDITITGYGSDGSNPNFATPARRHCNSMQNPFSPTNAFGTSQLNLTQQTATGATTNVTNQNVYYNTPTCGGNSGAVLLQNRGNPARATVVGVHTGGAPNGCGAGDVPTNIGTNLAFADFQNSVSEMCNICDQNNDGRINNTDLNMLRAAMGTAVTNANRAMIGRLDADGDGMITVRDLRICSLLCTNGDCQ